MNFAELRFWEMLFWGLALILGARWVVNRKFPAQIQTYDKISLLLLSLFLLLCVNWLTFLIFLAVAIGTYFGLGWIVEHHPRQATRYLFVLIPVQLIPLLFYKYADFVANRVIGLDFDLFRNLVIPVGISFYTFQKIAFVVDTLAFKQPLPRFLDYLNFAGFFPQIVAGPIERRASLLPQMEQFRYRWSARDINEGFSWMVVGLFFKCCLADNLSDHFDPQSATNSYLIWLANLTFGLRIYYDFAGYSLIAFGLARCFGVQLTLNFLSPYCSTSITEFWRRWHVTLSQWFRDYLYVPLGGNRTRWWFLTVALVFIVSGIWHGAGWNFILWGGLHGLFLILNRRCAHWNLPRAMAWSITLTGAFFAWLCFYELRTTVLLTKIQSLLTPTAYNAQAWQEAALSWSTGRGVVFAGLMMLALATLLMEWLSVRRHQEAYHYLRRPWVLVLLVFLTVWLAPGKDNGFIYFAF